MKSLLDRIWHSGKVNTLFAALGVFLYALYEVWAAGGFQIPKDRAGVLALCVLALRLIWARDHKQPEKENQ